jgi:hypothetical protein
MSGHAHKVTHQARLLILGSTAVAPLHLRVRTRVREAGRASRSERGTSSNWSIPSRESTSQLDPPSGDHRPVTIQGSQQAPHGPRVRSGPGFGTSTPFSVISRRHCSRSSAATRFGSADSTSTTFVRDLCPVTIRTRLCDTPSASASALTVAAFALPSTARAATRTMRTGGSESPYLPPTLVVGAPGDTRTTMRIDPSPIRRGRGAWLIARDW